MSYIPDCRTDENYNENNLNDDDATFIDGFDWAVERAVDNFFDNNFIEGMDDSSYIGHLMTQKLPKSLKENYEIEFKYDEDHEPVTRCVETIADYIRSKLLDWVESCRNELIVSMIDDSDDE